MRDEITHIYALINPINNHVFYIGATVDPPFRLQCHITDKSGGKSKRKIIGEIISKGLTIDMEILETCIIAEASFWEEFYIDLFKSYGFELRQSTISTYSKVYNERNFTNCIKLNKKITKPKIVRIISELAKVWGITPSEACCRLLNEGAVREDEMRKQKSA